MGLAYTTVANMSRVDRRLQELVDRLGQADVYGKPVSLSAADVRLLWLYVLPPDWRQAYPVRSRSDFVRRERFQDDEEPTSPGVPLDKLALIKR